MRRTRDIDPEPCSIDLATVAQYLERAGRPRMAEFVRHMQGMERRHIEERNRLNLELSLISERLAELEPAKTHVVYEPYDPRPPADQSD